MKHKVIYILSFLLLLLLLSCTSESFTIGDATFTRNIYIAEDERREEGIINLNINEESDKAKTYTFRLLSPDGDLSWEGKLEGDRGMYHSQPLALTPSSIFPEGEYTLYIYSSLGSSKDIKVEINKVESKLGSLSDLPINSEVTMFERDSSQTDNIKDADWAIIEYQDKYSNNITIREEIYN